MPGPTPDPDLIRRWQRGERSAFEGIVRLYQEPVGRFLARLTGSPELAADLTQEVFLRVFLAAGRYRDDGRFGTWVYQIAVNLARDAARRSARRPTTPFDADPPAPADAAAEDRERTELVAAALADLPAPLREVVVLRHYEDLSFEAMAKLLCTPASTLKSRFAVALRQLQERLANTGLAPERFHDL
jgi:RNA polymerase sigma-70 factor (ECF subfamily)